MEGKLIVIESGTDGSGKATQAERLYKRLLQENYRVHKIEYPDYESDSSALVKMYLRGDFGEKPDDVNSYAASAFYAVDRFASYRRKWIKWYRRGDIIIADRYTTSNMVHQAVKIKKRKEKEEYLKWLWDLEFEKFGLPVPSLVIFLDMPPEKSKAILAERKKRDIHERDDNYLLDSYNNACWVADYYNWAKVSCVHDGKLKSIDKIHEEVYSQVVRKVLANGMNKPKRRE